MKRKFTLDDAGDGFEFYEILDGSGETIGLVIEGEFDLEQEDLGTYVRVEFCGGGSAPYLYTYEDIGLGLEIGDLVDVPTKYEEHNLAQVKALGRGVYKGDPAPVLARYSREDAGVEW